jgi:hypothetical protein
MAQLRFVDTLAKVECRQCGDFKIALHFYRDANGYLSTECKICRRKRSAVPTIPGFDTGEWQQRQSGYAGPGVNQFTRRKKPNAIS